MVIATEGQQDVMIRLAKGMSIAGRVVLPEGMTQVGGTVSGPSRARGARGAGKVEARLSPSGAFRISGIPSDVRVEVRVRLWSRPDEALLLAPAVAEDVEPGCEDLVIRMEVGAC